MGDFIHTAMACQSPTGWAPTKAAKSIAHGVGYHKGSYKGSHKGSYKGSQSKSQNQAGCLRVRLSKMTGIKPTITRASEGKAASPKRSSRAS